MNGIQDMSHLFVDIILNLSDQMEDVAMFASRGSLDNYFIYLTPKSINVPAVKDLMEIYNAEVCSPPSKDSVGLLAGDNSAWNLLE